MRNTIKTTIGAAVLAAFAFSAFAAHAEPSMDHSSPTKPEDGNGGPKPVAKAPKGPGIFVVDENGKLVPYKPKSKHDIVIKHVTVDKRTTKWTYWLMQDGKTGDLYINITDADGNRVAMNGEVPMPGGGPTYPVR
jgi:hypothetical protein